MQVASEEGGMPIFWDKIHYGERGGAGDWDEFKIYLTMNRSENAFLPYFNMAI
jgi:hypothetical protein